MTRRSFQSGSICVTGKDGAIAQRVVFTDASDAYSHSSEPTILVLPFLRWCNGLYRVQVRHPKLSF